MTPSVEILVGDAIGIELKPEYADLIRKRLAAVTPSLPFHQGETA